MLSLHTFLKLTGILGDDTKILYLRKSMSQVQIEDWDKMTGYEVKYMYDTKHTEILDVQVCMQERKFLGYLLTIEEINV